MEDTLLENVLIGSLPSEETLSLNIRLDEEYIDYLIKHKEDPSPVAFIQFDDKEAKNNLLTFDNKTVPFTISKPLTRTEIISPFYDDEDELFYANIGIVDYQILVNPRRSKIVLKTLQKQEEKHINSRHNSIIDIEPSISKHDSMDITIETSSNKKIDIKESIEELNTINSKLYMDILHWLLLHISSSILSLDQCIQDLFPSYKDIFTEFLFKTKIMYLLKDICFIYKGEIHIHPSIIKQHSTALRDILTNETKENLDKELLFSKVLSSQNTKGIKRQLSDSKTIKRSRKEMKINNDNNNNNNNNSPEKPMESNQNTSLISSSSTTTTSLSAISSLPNTLDTMIEYIQTRFVDSLLIDHDIFPLYYEYNSLFHASMKPIQTEKEYNKTMHFLQVLSILEQYTVETQKQLLSNNNLSKTNNAIELKFFELFMKESQIYKSKILSLLSIYEKEQ
ncbi:hypothetical protein WA158_005563 [Blastocystis sp. Blastoise]